MSITSSLIAAVIVLLLVLGVGAITVLLKQRTSQVPKRPSTPKGATATSESSAVALPVLPGYSLMSSNGLACDVSPALTAYRMVAIGTSQLAALKIIDLAVLPHGTALRQKLEQQLAIAQTLNHPNCARVLGSNARAAMPYFVEEWLSEGSLQDYLHAGEPLAEADVITLVGQICDGLAYLHARNVGHELITPTHIRFDENGVAHLIHCGFARLLSPTPSAQTNDLYELGLIAFQMATGRPAFGPGAATIPHRQQQLAQDARQLNPALSEKFAQVLHMSIHANPAQRFQTPLAMAQAFGFAQPFHGMQDATHVFVMPQKSLVAPNKSFLRRPATGPLKLYNAVSSSIITVMPPRTIVTRDLINADDTMISRTNGEFFYANEAWHLGEFADAKSANGIYINEVRVTQPKQLFMGDHVRVGKTVLKVHG